MDACLLVSPGAVATLAPAARSRTSVRRSWLAGGDSSTRSSTPRPLTMITSSSFTAPRSEERRVGKEWIPGREREHRKEKVRRVQDQDLSGAMTLLAGD